jgi:hypothetical protein
MNIGPRHLDVAVYMRDAVKAIILWNFLAWQDILAGYFKEPGILSAYRICSFYRLNQIGNMYDRHSWDSLS